MSDSENDRDDASLETELLNEPLPPAEPAKPETEWQAIARGLKVAVLWFGFCTLVILGTLIHYTPRLVWVRVRGLDQFGILGPYLIVAVVVGCGAALIGFFIGYYGVYSGAEIIEERAKDLLKGPDPDDETAELQRKVDDEFWNG